MLMDGNISKYWPSKDKPKIRPSYHNTPDTIQYLAIAIAIGYKIIIALLSAQFGTVKKYTIDNELCIENIG